MKIRIKAMGLFVAVATVLSACGGGGGGSAVSPGTPTSTNLTVTGTAATGLAIPGATITGKCKVGTGIATTLADGSYTLTITDGQLPCVLQITNPVDGIKLHTVVTGTGSTANANITPLTEMATARVLGSEPSVFFAAFDAAVATQKITSTSVQAAQTDVGLVLTGTVDTAALGNFISAPLKAATQDRPTSGDVQDKQLDALKLRLTSTQVGTLTTALASNKTTDAIKQTVASMTGGGVSTPVATVNSALSWATSGNLLYERYQHTASVLKDGSILVAGGMNLNSLGLITAERYDPVTGIWAEVGRMNRDRSQHSATVLQSGKVLVVGGAQGNTAPMVDVEIFEPLTNTWAKSISLNTARRNHTATLLADGSVLAAGSSIMDTKSTEVFDPVSEKWTIKGDMSTVRSSHTATLLMDGRVLVAGGQGSALDGSPPTATAELYDPRTGSWTATGSMASARTSHTATLLPNGKVLVAGGETTIPSSAELYDPTTGAWSAAAPMKTARYAHASLALSSGLVLITGGTIPGNPKLGIPNQIADSAEMYDFRTDSWTSAGKLSVGRFYHTASLLQSGKVLIAGGYRPTVITELFTPF